MMYWYLIALNFLPLSLKEECLTICEKKKCTGSHLTTNSIPSSIINQDARLNPPVAAEKQQFAELIFINEELRSLLNDLLKMNVIMKKPILIISHILFWVFTALSSPYIFEMGFFFITHALQ